MISQDSVRLAAPMIFSIEAVLAWGPSSAWLDQTRSAPLPRRAQSRLPAAVTAFVEPD